MDLQWERERAGSPIPPVRKLMGTCQSGMRSPAVSLFGLGKVSQRRTFRPISSTCILSRQAASLPTVPFCFFALHSSSSVLSYLPPSFVNSHRLLHRQSLPDLQQTDSVSRSAIYLFPCYSESTLEPYFPFRSLNPASGLPT